MKTRRVASAARAGLTIGACLVGLVSVASSMTTSDKPASILMWPKVVVTESTDTLVDISNVSSNLVAAHCWLINANSHCASSSSNAGAPCENSSDCPLELRQGYAACVPGWSEIDFEINITPDQPLAWRASAGLRPCRGSGCGPCNPGTQDCGLSEDEFPLNERGQCVVLSGGKPQPTGQSCNPDVPSSAGSCAGAGATCRRAISNAGSSVPPVPEIPFVGAIKCVQYDPETEVPEQSSRHNALIGHAAITNTGAIMAEYDGVDVERYNAVGLLHLNSRAYNGTLKLDKDMYEKCPATLVLDHPFEGAPILCGDGVTDLGGACDIDPSFIGGGALTDLTLLPCGDDFLRQIPGQSVAQLLVINEFEQRLSASKRVDCFYESVLSGIDTNTPSRSIFSYKVQGTLVGQTWIRGTGSADTGHGLVGVARSSAGRYYNAGSNKYGIPDYNKTYGSGVAYNLQQKGDNSGTDSIVQP